MSCHCDQHPIIENFPKTEGKKIIAYIRLTNISCSSYFSQNWSDSKYLTSITLLRQMTNQIIASSVPSGGKFRRLAIQIVESVTERYLFSFSVL